MPDIAPALAQISIAVPKGAAKPVAATQQAASGAAETGDFADALQAMLAGGALPDARQLLAGAGKKLPDAGDATDSTADGATGEAKADKDQPDAADIAFAWFGAGLTPPAPAPGTSIARQTPATGQPVSTGARLTGATAGGTPASATGGTTDSTSAGATTSPATGFDTTIANALADAASLTDPARPAPDPATAKPVTPQQAQPQQAAQTPAAIPLPDVALSLQTPTLAAHPAGASLAAAALTTPVEGSAPRRTLRDVTAETLLTTAAPDAPAAPAVAATGNAQQGALDTSQQQWVGHMIDRIEALREAMPDKNGTRITLMPDALGKVDVSIRTEGDRVHVHFATETQAARQLLTDAQPRLGELADARGVKLGQTSVDAGTTGAGSGFADQQQQRPADHQPPRAPLSMRPAGVVAADTAADATSDQRIA